MLSVIQAECRKLAQQHIFIFTLSVVLPNVVEPKHSLFTFPVLPSLGLTFCTFLQKWL